MKKIILALVSCFATILLFSNTPDSTLVNKYLALADTWGTVKYLHPAAASGKLDWNNAFIEAIRDLDQDSSEDTVKNRADIMLQKLNDPNTFIVFKEEFETSRITDNKLKLKKHIIYLNLNDPTTINSARVDSLLQKTLELSYTERGLIIDLRNFIASDTDLRSIFAKNNFIENLVQGTMNIPAFSSLNYLGFPNEQKPMGIYGKRELVEGTFPPLIGQREVDEIPIIIITNANSNYTLNLVALSLNGKAQIISTDMTSGQFADDLENGYYRANIQFTSWSLNQQTYRTFIHKYLNEKLSENELEKMALKMLKGKIRTELPTISNTSMNNSDRFSKIEEYPSKEERILALAKLYTVTRFFNLHKDLMSLSPEENFKVVFPDIVSAKNAIEYNEAVAHFLVNLNDSHCFIYSRVFFKKYFTAGFPFKLEKIAGKFYISKIIIKDYAEENNLKLGDEIIRLEDKSLTEIYSNTEKIISNSNQNRAKNYISNMMLNGEAESDIPLTIMRDNERIITNVNRLSFREIWKLGITQKDTIKILDNNIGYVNLDDLAENAVPRMLAEIKDCKGVIFDMRGYPNMIMWELATYLTDQKVIRSKHVIPIFSRKFFWDWNAGYQTSLDYTQGIEKKIDVPIVVLMNAETQSQAEGTCSTIKELTGAIFIGEQTAGANGNITKISLPGKMYTSFTGMDPQDPRGVSQQGIGLLPDIEVRPSLEGIKTGRDEVLEAALEFLGEKIGK